MILTFIVSLLISGCDFFSQPPYILEKKDIVHGPCAKVVIKDTDGDGLDNVYLLRIGNPRSFASKIDVRGFPNNQNINEYALEFLAKDFDICDLSGKGNYYIIATSILKNSSYIHYAPFVREVIRDFSRIPITTGTNSFGAELDSSWDGELLVHSFYDLNHDGYKDAILIMDVSYDKGERGVAVVDIKNKRLLWKYPTGCRIGNVSVLDINHDQRYEIFVDTHAPDNGLDVNGTNDRQAYYLVLDENGQVIVQQPYGGKGGVLFNYFFDIDNDGQAEIIQFFSGSFAQAWAKSHLRILEWGITDEEPRKTLNASYAHLVINGDEQSKFYFCYFSYDQPYIFRILNHNFDEVKTITFKEKLASFYKTVDFNGDGFDDLRICLSEYAGKHYILTSKFDLFLTITEPFHDYYKARAIHGGPDIFFARDMNKTIWEVALKSNDLRYKALLKFAAYALPWFLVMLSLILLRNKRKQPSFQFMLQKYFDHLNIGLALVDTAKTVILINQRAKQLLQLNVLIYPISLEKFCEKLTEELRKEIDEAFAIYPPCRSFEFALSSGEQMQHLFLNIMAVSDERNQIQATLITIEDITKLIQSQRSIAFAALTQRMAHDIKNPLSNTRLTLEHLKIEARTLPEKYKAKLEAYLQSVESNIDLVRRVTDGFLQFSDLRKPHLETVRPHDILDQIIMKRLPVIQNRIDIKKQFTHEAVELQADRDLFTRVLDNILDNSVKAIKEQGMIIISTKISELIEKDTAQVEKYFEMEIEDSGEGMEEPLLEKIFEPFVSKSPGGTGLGLAIVKKIIDDHNGKITAHSQVGVGTRLAIRLPLGSEESRAESVERRA